MYGKKIRKFIFSDILSDHFFEDFKKKFIQYYPTSQNHEVTVTIKPSSDN